MRKGRTQNTVISICLAVCLASCTTIKSSLTYKAISKNHESCKLGITKNIWLDNDKVETFVTTQYRMLDMRPGFTDAELDDARFSSSVLINYFKYNIERILNSKLSQNTENTCTLTITPVKATHDARGGDSIALKSTLSNKLSGNPVWSVKIETRASSSGQNLEMVESFTEKLSSEIKRDGFNAM